jgi:putative effector of murein hydrolase LrgA (UPF0299 family)
MKRLRQILSAAIGWLALLFIITVTLMDLSHLLLAWWHHDIDRMVNRAIVFTVTTSWLVQYMTEDP